MKAILWAGAIAVLVALPASARTPISTERRIGLESNAPHLDPSYSNNADKAVAEAYGACFRQCLLVYVTCTQAAEPYECKPIADPCMKTCRPR
jgi:hypothetical protein